MGLGQNLYRKALIYLFAALFLMNISDANADVETDVDARRFLSNYCITLVNEIEKSYQKQLDALEKNKMIEFTKVSKYIYGVSDLYDNLDCSIYINK
ncbi:MAG: hypothetical protein CMA30_08680 [Euryarchaeota archaeon]|nr:hypothetical protein [Euryarchaeota archaeon]|tara:strand:- start:1855 stop:2145 length:291 start_codon:yes stop_codon:yes gene_type:complete